MITSKRPCDRTLSGVHVFRDRQTQMRVPGEIVLSCVCGERANEDEHKAWMAAVEQHKREQQEALAARIRRGEA